MRAVLLAVVVVAAACASAGDGPRRDPNLITRAEIDDRATNYENALEVVQALRSRWLRPAPGTSIMAGQGQIRVYVDGAPSQGLGTIPKLIVQEIRYYPPTEAQARWGLSHQRGAIEVITRRGGGG